MPLTTFTIDQTERLRELGMIEKRVLAVTVNVIKVGEGPSLNVGLAIQLKVRHNATHLDVLNRWVLAQKRKFSLAYGAFVL